MQIKIVATILVFLGMLLGGTVETLAPSELHLEETSYVDTVTVEEVSYIE